MNIPLLLEDLRVFIYGGIQSLPLTIAGLFLILGLFSANYAYIFFLIGFLIIAPLGSIILNSMVEALSYFMPVLGLTEKLTIKCSDQLNLIIPFGSNSSSQSKFVVTSYWMAMIAFFFGYLFTNAINIMSYETVIPDELPNVEKAKLKRQADFRKSSMYVVLITLCIVSASLFIFRYTKSCEPFSLWSAIPSITIFGTLGMGWYKLLSATGQDRLSDIFGIANRLLSPDALVNQPVACLPVA